MHRVTFLVPSYHSKTAVGRAHALLLSLRSFTYKYPKFDIENLMLSSFLFFSSIKSIVHVLEDRTSLFNYFLTQYLAFVCEKDEFIDTCLSLFFLLSKNQYTVLPSFLGA